jgi:site-specific DNA recombinase
MAVDLKTIDIEDAFKKDWFVAFYLRKSRGEEENDLEKHRWILKKYASKHGWKFIEYTEIANSETIKYRPKFIQLLNDVESGMFNAVLVVDYERLGRGDLEDQALVKRVFRESATFIVTPEKTYNPLDDSDDLLIDVRGLLARQAYKTIKHVLQRGKKAGSAQGHWTNGTPPYPYRYDPLKKGLVVDAEWNEIYLLFKKMIFEGCNLTEIKYTANRSGKRTPKGNVWQENTIRRILIDETHLGRIISNKTEGSAHKNKNTKPLKHKPREEWLIVENCHEAVKTLEEHERILVTLNKRKRISHPARAGGYILSGLVYCGHCKKCCQFDTKKEKHIYTRPCRKPDHFGIKCFNRMLPEKVLIMVINEKLQEYEGRLLSTNSVEEKNKQVYLEQSLYQKEVDLAKSKKALLNAKIMKEEGEYTDEEYQERKSKREAEITKTESEIAKIKTEMNYEEQVSNEERIAKINTFKELWNSNTEAKKKNTIAKDVIQRIEYTRDDKDLINIDVTFY